MRMDFFRDPLLRLTEPSSLNDPFDSKPTKEAIRKKIAFLTDDCGEGAGFISDQEIDTQHSGIKKDLAERLSKFGIISLTETPHNLLMWSHYADEHNGIVIEIFNEKDVFNFSNSGVEDSRIAEKTPLRVRYDNKRPGFTMPDECIFSIYEDEFFRHIALVKSNDWMYEKEHRFLLPISEADVVILKTDLNPIDKAAFEVKLKQMGIGFREVLGGYIFENEDLNDPFRVVQKVRFDKDISSKGRLIFFKRVNPDAIRAIYFGCRVPKAKIVEAMRMCEQSKLFSANLLFYKACESVDKFEVEFKAL